jgi:hypothetical protein
MDDGRHFCGAPEIWCDREQEGGFFFLDELLLLLLLLHSWSFP